MKTNKTDVIIANQELVRAIVYAINKAISDDVPQHRREEKTETNNRFIFAPSDYINDNLRKHVVKDEIELIPFNRYSWEGRILVDRRNKVTYTISTHKSLEAVIHKNRSKPHYLHSILYAENSDCQGRVKQLSMGDVYAGFMTVPFENEVLEEDYEKIMKGSISKEDYKHYVVVYTAEHYTITKIELLLLNNVFEEVDKLNLMEYVTPDFASLTENDFDISDTIVGDTTEKKTMSLKLKPGVKPSLRVMEDEV